MPTMRSTGCFSKMLHQPQREDERRSSQKQVSRLSRLVDQAVLGRMKTNAELRAGLMPWVPQSLHSKGPEWKRVRIKMRTVQSPPHHPRRVGRTVACTLWRTLAPIRQPHTELAVSAHVCCATPPVTAFGTICVLQKPRIGDHAAAWPAGDPSSFQCAHRSPAVVGAGMPASGSGDASAVRVACSFAGGGQLPARAS